MAITWTGNAWAATTAYVLNARVVNVGNVYLCTTGGTSAGSGGPTGTGSAITDGSVVWKYLGTNTGAVVDVSLGLSTTAFPSQVLFLNLAEALVVDLDVWGDLLDYGRLYLAGHFGELAVLRGKGPVTSEAVGELSRGYASLVGPFAIDLTPCGRQYMDLVHTTRATLGLVVGMS